ncbi:uncharacterized protein N7484_009742 [Penicillium longicatenatum]|uniref:uncharacterized protein n=1 Tax=Penicillium longicatenatum TaxID=1561947 RepID=UPI0025493A09|nr:uncharacterized protein N7484_009742 [Penicillium longicatenatum]KAJ5636429.1 hypothetical protein N7484_009742 [Penicillium longicatenatum]
MNLKRHGKNEINSISSVSSHAAGAINPQKSGWRPIYLRKWVLILFVITFCAIIAVLEVLNYVSSANQGLASSVESRHYLWTYGPTAILTVIAALWARVEFQAKQSAPWQAMFEKPEEPEKSVLLDYISGMQPVALVSAMGNKHYVVAAGIACSLLLRLLIIVSTSLFSLEEVQVSKSNVPILLQGNFSTLSVSDFSNAVYNPFNVINGILFADVSYMDGTTANLTFPTFSAPTISNDSVIMANITGLVSNLDCESAHLDINLWQLQTVWVGSKSPGGTVQVEDNVLSSSTCDISNVSISIPSNQETGAQVTSKTPFAARLKSGKCSNSDDLNENRVIMIAVEAHLGNSTESPYGNFTADGIDFYGNSDWHRTTVNITAKRVVAAICKPTFSILRMMATTNTTDKSSTTHLEVTGIERTDLPHLTAWQVAKNILEESVDIDIYQPIVDSDQFRATNKTLVDVDYSIQLGAKFIGETGSIDNLLKDGVLSNAASTYYRAMGAQLVHQGLISQSQSASLGSAVVSENRVIMAQVPLRAMEACLTLITMFAITMVVLVTTAQLSPFNPTSIAAVAAILSNSKVLRESLCGSSATRLKRLSQILQRRRYYTERTPEGFCIAAVGDETKSHIEYNDTKLKPQKPQWSPLPNKMFRVIIFIVVTLLIVALETLLYFSQSNDGLGDVPSNDETIHYLWTMIPALVMVIIGLLFGSMDFNTRCLAPYVSLKHETGASSQFMAMDFLDSLSTTTIVKSVRMKHFAVLAATLATLITSFLTIVTSGLYTAVNVPGKITMDFTQETSFQGASSGDYETGVLTAEYILQDNLAYPRWTYKELAFPKLSMNTTTNRNLSDSFVDILVPAMRGTVACKLQTGDELNATFSSSEMTITYDILNEPCSFNSTSWTKQTLTFDLEPHTLFGRSVPNTCVGDQASGTVKVSASSIATMSYIWGTMQNDSFKHIAALTCQESAEIVDTQTRFILPDFDISETNPPVPDESTARTAKNYTTSDAWGTMSQSDPGVMFDSFFQSLIFGKYAIPEEWVGSKAYNQKVIDAIKFQNIFMRAQVFNTFNRETVDGSGVSPLAGNVTTSGQRRLFQDVVSTRVLDILLGLLLLLGISGSVLMNTDHVLPKNPCSIAAVASLLADSNFLHRFGADVDPNDKGIEKLFSNCRFFLGLCYDGPLRGSNDDRFTVYLTDYGIEKDLPLAPEEMI